MNDIVLSHLEHLFADARQDVHLFRQRLEQWFDETMQRANGWYKKQTQLTLIFVGLFTAWLFNIDTIAIYNILATNKEARKNLVEIAIENKDKYEARVVWLDTAINKRTKNTVVVQQVADSLRKQT